jgi:hypothetical protein
MSMADKSLQKTAKTARTAARARSTSRRLMKRVFRLLGKY